jgi:hypothetical protein
MRRETTGGDDDEEMRWNISILERERKKLPDDSRKSGDI